MFNAIKDNTFMLFFATGYVVENIWHLSRNYIIIMTWLPKQFFIIFKAFFALSQYYSITMSKQSEKLDFRTA